MPFPFCSSLRRRSVPSAARRYGAAAVIARVLVAIAQRRLDPRDALADRRGKLLELSFCEAPARVEAPRLQRREWNAPLPEGGQMLANDVELTAKLVFVAAKEA